MEADSGSRPGSRGAGDVRHGPRCCSPAPSPTSHRRRPSWRPGPGTSPPPSSWPAIGRDYLAGHTTAAHAVYGAAAQGTWLVATASPAPRC